MDGFLNSATLFVRRAGISGLVLLVLGLAAFRFGNVQFQDVPDCVDTGGNHLNYTAASGIFACGGSVGAFTGEVCTTWDSATAVTAQTIEFPLVWSTYAITALKSAVNGSGTYTVGASINGTPITGISAVTVSGSTNSTTLASGANTGVANDQITIVTSSPSGTVNQSYVCLVFTHPAN